MTCNFKKHASANITEILVLYSQNLSQRCIEHVLLEELQVKKAVLCDFTSFDT